MGCCATKEDKLYSHLYSQSINSKDIIVKKTVKHKYIFCCNYDIISSRIFRTEIKIIISNIHSSILFNTEYDKKHSKNNIYKIKYLTKQEKKLLFTINNYIIIVKCKNLVMKVKIYFTDTIFNNKIFSNTYSNIENILQKYMSSTDFLQIFKIPNNEENKTIVGFDYPNNFTSYRCKFYMKEDVVYLTVKKNITYEMQYEFKKINSYIII
jgi:hypothetical protein